MVTAKQIDIVKLTTELSGIKLLIKDGRLGGKYVGYHLELIELNADGKQTDSGLSILPNEIDNLIIGLLEAKKELTLLLI